MFTATTEADAPILVPTSDAEDNSQEEASYYDDEQEGEGDYSAEEDEE